MLLIIISTLSSARVHVVPLRSTMRRACASSGGASMKMGGHGDGAQGVVQFHIVDLAAEQHDAGLLPAGVLNSLEAASQAALDHAFMAVAFH